MPHTLPPNNVCGNRTRHSGLPNHTAARLRALACWLAPLPLASIRLFGLKPLVGALAAAALSLAAAPLNSVDDAAGAWEMSLDGSYRKCRVTLGSEDLGSARPLRFPAGCRRALPILNATAGWAFENGLIRFLGKDGEPVLAFEAREAEQEGLVARTFTGEVFLLAFQERPPQIPPASTSTASLQQELKSEPLQEARRLMPPLYA